MKNILIIILVLGINPVVIYAQNADSIVVHKANRKLILYENNKELASFKVSLGASPKGTKEKEGDEKTPEGDYLIFDKNPSSDYHKNLGINYPNAQDKILKRTGGDIKIHGLGKKYAKWGKLHRLKDWTDGCIAVTNKEMDFIYDHVSKKTPIIIYP